jgi:ABC-type multidrug transport system ATPase subunit
MPDPAPSLVLDGLTKRYGSAALVLDGFSARLEPSTATGLVGPNGSGKTTLMRLLTAASYPTSGTVRYGGIDVHEAPRAYLQHVGLVQAEGALPAYLNAEEVLETVLRTRGQWSDEASPERIARLLDAVRLDERRAALTRTYSSGMLKKTQIAAALVHDPAIVLLDEPFRGLDEPSTEAAVRLLEAAKERGAILLVASHRRDVIAPLCERFLSLGEATSEATG